MNGPSKSGLVDSTGAPAPVAGAWQWPGPQSPFFGWMGALGFTTIRMELIKAVTPHPQKAAMHLVFLEGNLNLEMNCEDAERLLKRMGWTEPKR